MISNIYKTEEGKNIVESIYSNILAGYSLHPFKQSFIPTKIATNPDFEFYQKCPAEAQKFM